MNEAKFNIEDISNLFQNVNQKVCNTPGYDYAFDIMDNGKFIGELFYCNTLRQWCFIKDNYPLRRAAYHTTFPIKTIELFVDLFASVGVKLIMN